MVRRTSAERKTLFISLRRTLLKIPIKTNSLKFLTTLVI